MEYTVSVVRTCPERSGRGPSAGCGLELSATTVREYLHSSRTRVSAPHQSPFSDNLSSPNESNTCWNFGGSFSVLEDEAKVPGHCPFAGGGIYGSWEK